MQKSNTPDAQKELHRLAIALEEAFDRTGDQRFLDASKVLLTKRQKGRRPEADTDALYRMAALLEARSVNSRWAAARRVAEEIGGHSLKSTAVRLDRKYARHGCYYQRTSGMLRTRELIEQVNRVVRRAQERLAPALAAWETNTADLRRVLALQEPGLSPEELRDLRGS